MSDMSENAKSALRVLGDFGPTVHVADREVKGVVRKDDPWEDGRTYISSDDLRLIGAGLIEAADYLDARALAALPEKP